VGELEDISMRSLVVFYNDTEGWVHTLTCEVTPGGAHTVVDSTTHYPNNNNHNLLTFASNYHLQAGVERERVNIFRTEKVMTGNNPTFIQP
jgi:hypothetical protein